MQSDAVERLIIGKVVRVGRWRSNAQLFGLSFLDRGQRSRARAAGVLSHWTPDWGRVWAALIWGARSTLGVPPVELPPLEVPPMKVPPVELSDGRGFNGLLYWWRPTQFFFLLLTPQLIFLFQTRCAKELSTRPFNRRLRGREHVLQLEAPDLGRERRPVLPGDRSWKVWICLRPLVRCCRFDEWLRWHWAGIHILAIHIGYNVL